MSGTADRMGERGSLLWLTALMVALVISLAWLSTRPRLFNLPVELTPGNAQSVYREGERMMVCLLVALVVIHLGAAMQVMGAGAGLPLVGAGDRKSTRLNSSHVAISYAVFCLKKKKKS